MYLKKFVGHISQLNAFRSIAGLEHAFNLFCKFYIQLSMLCCKINFSHQTLGHEEVQIYRVFGVSKIYTTQTLISIKI